MRGRSKLCKAPGLAAQVVEPKLKISVSVSLDLLNFIPPTSRLTVSLQSLIYQRKYAIFRFPTNEKVFVVIRPTFKMQTPSDFVL